MKSPCRADAGGKCAAGKVPGKKCRKVCEALKAFQRSFTALDTIRPAVDSSGDGYRFMWG